MDPISLILLVVKAASYLPVADVVMHGVKLPVTADVSDTILFGYSMAQIVGLLNVTSWLLHRASAVLTSLRGTVLDMVKKTPWSWDDHPGDILASWLIRVAHGSLWLGDAIGRIAAFAMRFMTTVNPKGAAGILDAGKIKSVADAANAVEQIVHSRG